MAEKTMLKNLNEGSVAEKLYLYALPLLFSNILQAVYNIIDMIVVGQVVGEFGMSAVSIGGDILHLLTCLAMGFSNASQIIISQYVGAKKKDKVTKLIGTLFTSIFSMAIVMAILSTIFRHNILRLLHTPEESYEMSMMYMVTCIAGLPFIYGYNAICGILRGMGDSKKPFIFISIAATMNIIFDILFVSKFEMGPFGAALATVLGQAFSFIASLVYLYKNRAAFNFDFKLKSFKADKYEMKNLLSLGIPMAIQSMAISFSRIVLLTWVNMLGVTYSAVMGIYNKLGTCISVTSSAFIAAGNTMTGQAIGAEKYDRVKKILFYTILPMIFIAGACIVLVLLVPEMVFGIFTKDVQVLAAIEFIIWPSVVFFIGAAGRTYAFALINGSGNSKLNLLVAILDGIIGRIGLAYLLGYTFDLGCTGFLMGDALAGLFPFAIGVGFYLSGKWKINRFVVNK